MRLFCSMGWHRPSPKTIDNEGRTFGRCKSCGIDLVKTSSGWKPAPRGYKVIWKKAVVRPRPAPEPIPEAVETGTPAKPRPARRKQPERRTQPKRATAKNGGTDRRKTTQRRNSSSTKQDTKET